NPLAAGASFTWGGPTLTIPAGTATGNYYIGILVDKDNGVCETIETNNYVSTPITVQCGADLVVSSGSPTVTPATVLPGGTVTLSGWTVKNQGTASTGTNVFNNGFYLSTDAVITGADTLLDFNGNNPLAAGALFTWGGPTLTIPAGTAPGNYYIGILVDKDSGVCESNAADNYVSTPITVQAACSSDLVVSSGTPTVTPATVAPGGTVTLSGWTVKNQGTASTGTNVFNNGFYLSSDAVITSTDTLLDFNGNNPLAAGALFTWGGPTLTIPAGTAPGNYYIGILVDKDNGVCESNETNNYVSTPLTV